MRLRLGRPGRVGIIVVLLITLAAGGCSKPAATTTPPFQGTLTIWAASGLAGYPGPAQPDSTWFQDQGRAYESAHPGVKVQLRMLTSPAELEAAVRAASPGGGPDLAFGRFLPESAPLLADLTAVVDQPALTEYLPHALEAFRVGSQQHGLPMLLQTQALALNESAFKAAGVTLPSLGSWSQAEFEDSLKRLSGSGSFGLGFYNLPGYHEWWPLLGAPINPGTAVQASAVSGLDRLARFLREGWIHPDTGKLTAEATWSLFARNSPAFAVMPVGTWAIALLRSPPFNAQFAIASFPGDFTLGYCYGVSVFAQREAERLKAAANLALFLTAPDRQMQLSRLTGLMPAGSRTDNPFEGDAALTRAFQFRTGYRALRVGAGGEQAGPDVARDLLLGLLGVRTPAESVQDAVTHMTTATPPASK